MSEAEAFNATPLIVILIVVVLAIWVLNKAIVVVHVAEGVVIERMGRFQKMLLPGLNFIVPFLDNPRIFQWKKTYININKQVVEENLDLYRVDMRESLFNFVPQEVYTKDTIQVRVNALMYYKITDVKKAIYGVEDLHQAVGNVAQAELKMLFGSMTFTEALSSQDKINDSLVPKFNKEFADWGVVCTRVEILDFRPSESVVRQLKLQMLAERNRRSEFIVAEGKKSAMRLESEGTRVQKYQMGVAEQEATRRISEGEAEGKVLLAQAESKSLSMVQQAIESDGASQSEYLITAKYLKFIENTLGRTATSGSEKTVHLPFAVEPIMGLVKQLPRLYGANADRSGGGVRRRAAASRPVDTFDELN
eukprot:Stramenopile-MAST_4_protein_2660